MAPLDEDDVEEDGSSDQPTIYVIDGPPRPEPIVVVGTRLPNSGPPTPVVAQTAETLLRSQPLGLAEALQQLPQFSGSLSARNRQAISSDGRGSYLNLRNVGPIRTLILLDGERLPPTTVGGLVDVDIIPEMLIKRVEVATSGVSAVYGSDAVTGVVNYVLDTKFTGLEAKAQAGLASRGDALNREFGLAGGTGLLDDRVHLQFSVEHSHAAELRLGDRPLQKRNLLAVGLNPALQPGTAGNPYVFASDVRNSLSTPGGRIITGPAAIAGAQFDAVGRVVPYDPGRFIGITTQIGGSGQPFDANRTLITGGKSTRAFGSLSYDLTDDITLFTQGLWSRNSTRFRTGINFATVPIFADNAFLDPTLRAILADPVQLPFGFDPVSAFVCGNGSPAALCLVRIPGDLSPPIHHQRDTSYTIKAGLRGELGDGWAFNATYIRGHTRQNVRTPGELNNTNLYAALDAVRASSGQIVCRVTLTNPGLYPGCVPYNPFGFGANEANRAAVEGFILGAPEYRVTNTTDDVIANLAGKLGETWAGPIRVAVGAEYRRNALRRVSTADPAVPQLRTGIRGIDPAAPPFVLTNAGAAGGSQNVKEANVEIEVPLAREETALHRLSISGAARYTDYSTSGGVTTWKLGASWEPVENLRFRAARSRDIRAPTLFDLFAGGTSARAPLFDVHCNCQSPTGVNVFGGGNPNLDPEIADSLSLGVQVKRSGFFASIDYYDLKIRKAITVLAPDQVIQECETAGGVGQACDAISRPLPFSDRTPANAATSVFTGAINAAALRTRGLDFDFNYAFALGSTELTASALATRVIRYQTQGLAAVPSVSSAGVIDHSLSAVTPKWTAKFDLAAKRGSTSGHVAARFIDSLKLGLPPGTPGGFVYEQKRLPSVTYIDVGLSQTVASGATEFEIFGDVHNLFDKQPPIFPGNLIAGLIYPTYLPLYDVVGRYMTMGVRIRR